MKPLLLKHFRVRFEPSPDGGEETLVFTSERRRIAISGNSLGEFLDLVVPLLDGRHTLEEIQERVATVYDPSDLEGSLTLLIQNRIVEDVERAAYPPRTLDRLGPELGYFREVSTDPAALVDSLAGTRVTVVGLGAVGAVAATALAAANVGHIRCVDSSTISPADPYLAQLFGLPDVGLSRAEVVRDKIELVNPTVSVEVFSDELETDRDVTAAIEGSNFVLGCLDPGLLSITYRLNRACLERGATWCSGTVSAFEGIVGPTVIPYETACYLCYQGRSVSCRDDPAAALADLKHQVESVTDTSMHRENLAFGAGIVGNLLALQAFKALTGIRPPTVGRILVVDFSSSMMRQHAVLRKPWCAACFPPEGS